MIQTDSDEHAYSGPYTNPELLKIHAAKIDNKIDYNNEWLNSSNPIENKYIQARQGRALNSALHEYFTISSTAENKLIQATNEVHLMYLHATEKY